MVCKKLKCYDDLKVMLHNYDQYIDFQYRDIFNMWSSLEIEEKFIFLPESYKKILNKLKEIREEFYKAQMSLYTRPISISFCGNECTCTCGRLDELQNAVQREVFRKVYDKLHKMNSKMHDFNLLCDSLMSSVFENNINRIRRQICG